MTTLPVVLTALTELAKATLGADWQVINGPVRSITVTKERMLLIGDEPVSGRRDLDSMSLLTTAEQYTVPLVANVDLPGTDQGAADAAALAAYEAIEAAVRTHPDGPNLGLGDSIQALPTGEFSLQRQADDDGRHAAVRFSIFIFAQTT